MQRPRYWQCVWPGMRSAALGRDARRAGAGPGKMRALLGFRPRYRWAVAAAEEFKAKHVNVVLGPARRR